MKKVHATLDEMRKRYLDSNLEGFVDLSVSDIRGHYILVLGLFYDRSSSKGVIFLDQMNAILVRAFNEKFKDDDLILHTTEQGRIYQPNGEDSNLFYFKIGCFDELACFHVLFNHHDRLKFKDKIVSFLGKLKETNHWSQWRDLFDEYQSLGYVYDWSVIRRDIRQNGMLALETFYYWRTSRHLLPKSSEKVAVLSTYQKID